MPRILENYYNDNTCTLENEDNNVTSSLDKIQQTSFKTETNELYVITIDDKPVFYQTNLDEARLKLLEISKELNNKINENDYYDSYICQKLEDEIIIINQLDFFLFTKNYSLHSLKIHVVTKF